MYNQSFLKFFLFFLLPVITHAHHNPIAYDGKKEVTISGIVTSAYFGNPHSRYRIDVKNAQGEVEEWLLMTEDPRDARNLGFEDEIKNIKEGDSITVVGWPHRSNQREIRGHKLLYPDGKVVMMRRGNYIWRGSMRQIHRMVSGRVEIDTDIKPGLSDSNTADRVINWIDENKMVPRIAFEVKNKTAQLIGLSRHGTIEFPGITELFECHTHRPGFTDVIDIDGLSEIEKNKIQDNLDFISKFNSTLARYWEQDIESCSL